MTVLTKAKHPPHRLGFADDPYRTTADVVEFARWVFLQLVVRLKPDVLEQLRAIAPARAPGSESTHEEPDPAALKDWATTSHLRAPWCLAYARASWRSWRRWPTSALAWSERDDLEGEQVPRRSRRAPRPLKNPAHFTWLVKFQVLEQSYSRIARDAGVHVQTVREACRGLAALMKLPLRKTRRGRPRKPAGAAR